MENTGVSKNQLLSTLSRSPHGALKEYLPTVQAAVKSEPEFLAHLIAWDRHKGQIRDAKVALPVTSLSVSGFPQELAENSLAHIALLGPRELARAYRFALEIRLPGSMQKMRRLVAQYLREKEADRFGWDRTAVQHRKTLKELYALAHVKPSEKADSILFKGDKPAGSVFEAISNLKNMSASEAAAAIVKFKIPFIVAGGALGENRKDPELVMTLIDRMTPTELVTNTKALEKLGLKTNPILRGAYENALQRTAKSSKNLLKTTRAAEAMDDEGLKEKLRGVQEKQIQNFGGVEGNWLVLADKSGSMAHAIEMSRQVAATLAKLVTGKVWLTFFDTHPQTIDVTGSALDHIQKATRYIQAGGGTSIGCGLKRMLDEKIEVDGIAIVSDGAEHSPPYFHLEYRKYCDFFGKDIPVYLYHCQGEPNSLSHTLNSAGIDHQVFDLTKTTDYYSIPNLAQTMRTSRYGLVDEVLATPLLTLADVFKRTDAKELTTA
jgi:hypothetical protein